MSLSALMRVMYDPASYAALCWQEKAGCSERQTALTRNRLLIQRLALACDCDSHWLEQPETSDFVGSWQQLRDATAVLGLVALKPHLLRTGYIHRLADETLAMLALPLRLPELPWRPTTIDREALVHHGASYVMAMAQSLPVALKQRLALVYPVGVTEGGVAATANAGFVFKLAVEHVKHHRIEA